MALHGINLPLAALGTEHVIAQAYGPAGLGLTELELEQFFPGPAFLAWNRMSNMDGPFAGPLTKDWRLRRASQMQRVYGRMRELGMTLVLPGFSGHVPCQLMRLYPRMKLAPRPHWQGYNSSCLLDPSDTVHYNLLASQFLSTQAGFFGDTHYYAFDQFNEMSPMENATLDYLRGMSASASTI